MTLDEFQRQLYATATASTICEVPVVRRISATSVNLRIAVALGGYIDAFFNEQTGTTAYAWIFDVRRAFGVDNTGGWHMHPLEDPERHDRLTESMPFSEFLRYLEQRAG